MLAVWTRRSIVSWIVQSLITRQGKQMRVCYSNLDDHATWLNTYLDICVWDSVKQQIPDLFVTCTKPLVINYLLSLNLKYIFASQKAWIYIILWFYQPKVDPFFYWRKFQRKLVMVSGFWSVTKKIYCLTCDFYNHT